MSKKNCGTLFTEALNVHTLNDAEVRLFTAGFVMGQAEKVHLGASLACMFRPSATNYEMVLALAIWASKHYGLELVRNTNEPKEIWLCRQEAVRDVKDLEKLVTDSPTWHRNRARLCGVPFAEINDHYHLLRRKE